MLSNAGLLYLPSQTSELVTKGCGCTNRDHGFHWIMFSRKMDCQPFLTTGTSRPMTPRKPDLVFDSLVSCQLRQSVLHEWELLLTGHSYPAPLRHTTPGVCVSNSCRIQSYQGFPSGLSGSGLHVNQGHLASASSDISSAAGGQNFFHGCSLSSSRTSPLWIGDVGSVIASSVMPF